MTGMVKQRVFSLAALSLTVLGLFGSEAHATIFELNLNGSYEERLSQFKNNQRRSWGVELAVPLTSFFQISGGYSYLEDKDVFNDDYRTFQESQGIVLPEGPLETIDTYVDTTVNGVLYTTLGYVRPSIFGGAMWRTYCEENSLVDYGCKEQDLSWNAGASLSVMVTYNTRLRMTYRVSPSVSAKNNTPLDTLISMGLTFSM